MTYVVTESCIRCKYTDCVDVCPVDCFREGPNFLVIDPDECIDCTLCVAECPVEAIFAEDDVPEDQQQFKALNAELAKIWKPIIERKRPPPHRRRRLPGILRRDATRRGCARAATASRAGARPFPRCTACRSSVVSTRRILRTRCASTRAAIAAIHRCGRSRAAFPTTTS